jgi:transcriptional regulator with XRE-family HTH domain
MRHATAASAAVDVPEEFGATVRRLRDAAGWSQMQLGQRCDMDLSAISRLERGQRDPQLTTIVRIARAFGVSPSELLRDIR